MFTEREIAGAAKVCVIGKTIREELFGSRDPIGEEIRLQNVPLTVLGVLEEKGANLLGSDQDDIVVAPWTTVKFRVTGTTASGRTRSDRSSLPGRSMTDRLPGVDLIMRSEGVRQILVKARSPESVPIAMDEITELLIDRHQVDESDPDFRVRDMSEVADALKNTIRLLSGLALSVATVSLVVGGVGIMNIMLVSVTERTREIGLRMALGAAARDILRQFLVESIVLCLFGGMIGILAGRGTSLLVGMFMDWPTQPSIAAAVFAVAVSATVGVVFGYYPAWKASRLNPIDALRYE